MRKHGASSSSVASPRTIPRVPTGGAEIRTSSVWRTSRTMPISSLRKKARQGFSILATDTRLTIGSSIDVSRKDAATAQLSLAWLLAQKPFIVPIPGTGKVKHLQENVEATNLALTAEDLREIDSALSEFKVHGGRMNEEQMKVVEE